MKNIEILDTTLRDGNYAVDFQFTARDTEIIAMALEKAGFRWIEIGHGLGLNASRKDKGVAAATDREYLAAVRNVVRRARYGMFFIPGIGRTRDIKMAKDLGMSFLRIGTNADCVSEAKKYIKLAKKLKFTVFSNLMKSYTLSPALLAEKAAEAEYYGTDVICIVDSAGGMLLEDVEEYFDKVRARVSAKLGFHGHNNLGLAVANTLKAIECGATIVDSSLQGLGRSGGNAATETLATILEKKGMLEGIDLRKTMDIGEKLVRPFFHKYGISPIDVTLGYAQFHSSFMSKISEVAKEYGVDERELVLKVSSRDRIAPSLKLMHNEAGKLKGARPGLPKTFLVKKINIDSKYLVSGKIATLESAVKEINSNSKRTGKLGILNIVFPAQGRNKKLRVSPFIQEDFSYIVGTVEASNAGQVSRIINAADGMVDYVLFDSTCEIKRSARMIKKAKSALKKTGLLLYSDYRTWINTVTREVEELAGDRSDLKIAVFGDMSYTLNTAVALAEMGNAVTLHIDGKRALELFHKDGMRLFPEKDALSASRKKDVLIGFSPARAVITKEMARGMNKGGVIIDAGVGSVAREAISCAHKRGIRVIRVDMRPVIAGEITSAIGIRQLVQSCIGKGKIKGKTVVSGGLIGKAGDIVVDSAKEPTKVVGIARGDGSVEYQNLAKHKKDIESVEREIMAKKVLMGA